MAEDEKFEASRAMRRAMLGADYVDAQTTDPNPVMREFSDYLTSMAWGVWTRGGALEHAGPEPGGAGDDGGARPHGRVPAARQRAVADRGHRRRARRAPLPDRGLLRRPGGGLRPAVAPGRARRRAAAERRDAWRRSASSASATWAASWRRTSSGAGHDVVSHDVAGPERSPARGRRSSPTWPSWPGRADVVVLSLPDGGVSEQVARGHRRRPATGGSTHVVDTSTIGVAAAQAIDGLLRRPASPMSTRRCPAASPGRGRGRCRSCTPGRDAACRGGRARAGRVERPAAPGRRPARHGPGAEAGQQLPLRHGAGRHQRGHRVRPLGRARHGDHAGGHRRVERAERGHQRQVPEPRADRPLRRRVRQLADGQGPAALPRSGGGARARRRCSGESRSRCGSASPRRSRGPTSPGSTRSWRADGRTSMGAKAGGTGVA